MTHDLEVDFGHHWQLPSGQRARLTWNAATGVLYLLHPEQRASKGASCLLVAPDRATVDHLLSGWGESQGDLEWLAKRLWLAGATLPDWAAPVSRGR